MRVPASFWTSFADIPTRSSGPRPVVFCGASRCSAIASDRSELYGQLYNLGSDLGVPRNLKIEESDRVAATTQLLHKVLTSANGS